jgi:hypothetical protein
MVLSFLTNYPGHVEKKSAIMFLMLRGLAIAVLCATCMMGQQPFLTDDADTAKKHQFHFETINEHDFLQRSSFPSLRQNTTKFQFNYGVTDRLEIGVDGPLLAIFNAPGSPYLLPVGIGDINTATKYRFHDEREGSRMPALTVAFDIEIPTGNVPKQLGSGLADYWLYGIAQKALTDKTTVRVNSGILFSGNTLTGVVGIGTKGRVYTGSSSITRKFSEKLELGAEIAGAFTKNFDLGKSQLQLLLGGKRALRRGVGIDFGVTAGKLEGAPRLGALLGFSVDF